MSNKDSWITRHLEEVAASMFPEKWTIFDEEVQRDFYSSLNIHEQMEVYGECSTRWFDEAREHAGAQI